MNPTFHLYFQPHYSTYPSGSKNNCANQDNLLHGRGRRFEISRAHHPNLCAIMHRTSNISRNHFGWVKYLITKLFTSARLFAQDDSGIPTVNFTNKIVTLTNTAGRKYENIRLIKADSSGILYVNQGDAGGGRILYTNLSADALRGIGLDGGVLAAATRAAQEEEESRKRLFELEKQAMHDRNNYRRLTLNAFGPVGSGGVCTFSDYPGTFLIYNLPQQAIDQLQKIAAQRSAIAQSESKTNKIRSKISEAQTQIANLKSQASQLKDARAQGEAAQLNQSNNVNYAWNIDINRRIERNSEDTDSAQERLGNLQRDEATAAEEIKRKKKDLEIMLGSEVLKVTAYISRVSKYHGNPIIYCADDSLSSGPKN